MKLSPPSIAACLVAACVQWAPLATDAAETWRCGNTYADRPCEGGMPVDLDDPRDAAQKREADDATREARAAADRLERERVRLERKSPKAILIDNAPHRTPPPKTHKKKRKNTRKADYFSAHDPVATERNKAAKAARKN